MRKSGGVKSVIAVAGLLLTIAASPSDARGPGPYDGLWSVSIFTRAGPCDASYRYPALISNGRVLQADGNFMYQLTGAVSSSGAIRVTVSSGGQSATGYGHLSYSRGYGRWRTAAGQCFGTWSAERRQ
jgi:hypothetical protein